jgi:hypothetical protein
LEIGLNNQRSILHQLYNLVISTTETHEDLEWSWKNLVQEEQQDRRNQRLAKETQEQGHN